MTAHRAENVDAPRRLAAIVRGVSESGLRVVFPVHPRTKAAMAVAKIEPGPGVRIVDAVGYLEMLVLEENAQAIVTDSGGVQKEAYFAGVPCITLRDATEWPETVDAGWNVLVGADPARIADAMQHFRPHGDRPDLFGDGHAADKVVAAMTAIT